MITKRWKTNVTGDEHSMRKIMEDFKAFCSNENDRLIQFWEIFEDWTGRIGQGTHDTDDIYP